MSFAELYAGGPLIISGNGDPVATVFGVPFDSTHSYKPGCRFGPDAIRDAFNNIEVFHPDMGIDLEKTPIRDIGNLAHTVSSDDMREMVKRVTSEIGGPKIILGGEHSITYASYSAMPRDTGFVVFDAHYDLRDKYAGARYSHASYLRRIVEERGSDLILHVGARAFATEELAFLTECRIPTITDGAIRSGKGPAALVDALSVFDSVYASFDMDVLDPAYAPGVGNPEAEGITSREMLDMVKAIGVRVEAADIVELNPGYDNGSTAALAAKILSIMLAKSAGASASA